MVERILIFVIGAFIGLITSAMLKAGKLEDLTRQNFMLKKELKKYNDEIDWNEIYD